MMQGSTVAIDHETLLCRVIGVEPTKIRLVQYKAQSGIAVFHESGTKYWSHRGHQGYAPSNFSVCRVKRSAGKSNAYVYLEIDEVIAEFPAMSRHWPIRWTLFKGEGP